MLSKTFSKLWNRQRPGLTETAALAGTIFALGAIAFEYEFSDSLTHDKKIDFQEAIALGVVYVACTIYFGWRRMIEQEREIERRVAAESRAHELANTDILTGLANRRQYEHALMETIASPPGAGKVHAVLAIDLNKFKRVNDVYGHPTGDDVLITVAQRLSAIMRDGDVLARLGGDEFAIIARHLASAESATSIANRVLKTLDEPIEVGSVQHHVGAGIGLALMPDDGASAEEIMRKADIALYRAKASKKSEAHFFELEMDRHSREREALERDLTTAIETGAVTPWYQPIVDLPTRKVIAFEALARWTHPTLGDIPPDRFIPIAEDCGLINRLSDYLLRRACTDAMAWPDDVLLSFNISPAQLKEKTLGLNILGILGETGLPPHRLEIEITENAVVRDLDTAKIVLGALREAGVRIALDDFGTGYSSLYHLRNFKFDAIKIDRSFVGDMAHASESAAIVRALTGLGHGLGLTITAEGIEQSGQRDALLSQGCERGQGFLFSRAVPAAQTQALLAPSHPDQYSAQYSAKSAKAVNAG
ncbi:MAG: EAL domain-containing protein [Pseudolabrys sp.]|nr:EAL domain-containing protein [Pseudolabrys sp.]